MIFSKLSSNVCYYEPGQKNVGYCLKVVYPMSVLKPGTWLLPLIG